MSASHEWVEYHLTPEGWVKGDEQWDFEERVRRPAPVSRVLTRRYDEYLPYALGETQYEVVQDFLSPDIDTVKQLLEQFGKHPDTEMCQRVARNALLPGLCV